MRWTTSYPGQAAVEVLFPGGDRRVFTAATKEFTPDQTGLKESFFRHATLLDGLEPATEYRYSARMDGHDVLPGEEHVFRTAGVTDFQFLALGDSGTGSAEQQQLARLIQREKPSLLIHTGDLAYPSGTFPNYERNYLDVYQSTMRRVPFLPCLGNHDYYETGGEPFRILHDLPGTNVPLRDQGNYYSFDWGDAHFVALDSNRPLEEAVAGRGEMLRWLEADLLATQKFWRVVFFHHPPHASGPNERDPLSILARQHIAPILEKLGVPVVFNGHEHSYQRTHPIRDRNVDPEGAVYITTGGGGAQLYPTSPAPWIAQRASVYHFLKVDVRGGLMKVSAVGVSGEAFDTFEVRPPPIIRGDIVNAASGTSMVGSGGLISIFGWQLSPETLAAEGGLLPKGAGGIRVALGDEELRTLFVSPTQINALLPRGLRGAQTLRVSSPGGEATRFLDILPVAPAIFPEGLFVEGRVQITSESPAMPGAIVHAFVTGMAEPNGSESVLFGGRKLAVTLDAAPLPAGVQQARFELPPGTPPGVWPVAIEADGVRSNTVFLAVG